MKRAERHHLKENELQRVATETRRLYTERQREATLGRSPRPAWWRSSAIGYFFWSEHVQSRAHELLAQATTVQDARIAVPGTPDAKGTFPTERARLQAAIVKFKAAADAYPSTDAGLFARSQEAAGQLALGNPALAVTAYQDVDQARRQQHLRSNRAARARGGSGARPASTIRRSARFGISRSARTDRSRWTAS